MTKTVRFPMRYVPKGLSRGDKKKQIRMLLASRRVYNKNKYLPRSKLASFHNRKSGHVANAKQLYRVSSLTPSKTLAAKTGCSLSALKKIVNKGEGAFYSSGSRPNQTPESWGLARLGSALTSGKAAAVDYAILEKGCDHKKKAFRLATLALYKGRSKARTIKVSLN